MKNQLHYAGPLSLALAIASNSCMLETAGSNTNTKDNNAEEPNKYCLAVPADKNLAPYQAIFDTTPRLKEIIDFCRYADSSLQEQMWDKIREAEETGLSPTASMPKAYQELGQNNLSKAIQMQPQSLPYFPEHFFAEYKVRRWNQGKLEEEIEVLSMDAESPITRIFLTKEEAHEIYAAHLAHSLWFQKNEKIPWKLEDYSFNQLWDLVKPEAFFYTWSDKHEIYAYSLIINHSPRESYEVAMEAIYSFSDQQAALNDIIKALRSYKHGTLNIDSQEIITIKGMSEEKISRHGCQTTSLFLVQVAKALNIPGRYVIGYYAGGGHRSALFEDTDQALAHGDDPYNRLVSNTPSAELMDSFNFWQNEVMRYEKGDPQGAHNSMIHNYKNGMKYPSWILLKNYCSGGFSELEEIFVNTEQGTFATAEELTEVEQKILQITENCTVFPEDNPDNKN